MYWETKKFVWLTFLQYSLHRGGLQTSKITNKQFLRDMTVIVVEGEKEKRKHLGKSEVCT